MKAQIWKYIITPNKLIHDIPKGCVIRAVGNQFEQICVWVEVDPTAPTEKRHFEVYKTLDDINYDMGSSRDYLGAVQLEGGAFIFHVYEYTGV